MVTPLLVRTWVTGVLKDERTVLWTVVDPFGNVDVTAEVVASGVVEKGTMLVV